MSWKGKLREMSEEHIADPEVCQAGVVAVGAEYRAELKTKNEWRGELSSTDQIGSLSDKGWEGKLEVGLE